jgi:putative pyruvate formate lyase activating enzyme
MIRQKGFLDSFKNNTKIAKKGVLVRHLILPENVKNSINVLTTLFLEFGKNIPISLMSQYYPAQHFKKEFLNRRITVEEFKQVYEQALSLGFTNMLVQFPYDFKTKKDETDFVPDFRKEKPFKGNKSLSETVSCQRRISRQMRILWTPSGGDPLDSSGENHLA